MSLNTSARSYQLQPERVRIPLMADRLQEAITLIKAGDKQAGGRLLVKTIKTNPQNEQAWLWMSAILATPKQRRYCLERVLSINPQNRLAKKGLAYLDARSGQTQSPLVAPPSLPNNRNAVEVASVTSSANRPLPSVARVAKSPTTSNQVQKSVANAHPPAPRLLKGKLVSRPQIGHLPTLQSITRPETPTINIPLPFLRTMPSFSPPPTIDRAAGPLAEEPVHTPQRLLISLIITVVLAGFIWLAYQFVHSSTAGLLQLAATIVIFTTGTILILLTAIWTIRSPNSRQT